MTAALVYTSPLGRALSTLLPFCDGISTTCMASPCSGALHLHSGTPYTLGPNTLDSTTVAISAPPASLMLALPLAMLLCMHQFYTDRMTIRGSSEPSRLQHCVELRIESSGNLLLALSRLQRWWQWPETSTGLIVIHLGRAPFPRQEYHDQGEQCRVETVSTCQV